MDLITLGIVAGSVLALAGIAFLVAVSLRRVVPTNEVHIVQSANNTTSYGLKSVMDVFSSQGGVEIGAMLEGLAATEKGQELIGKFLGGKKTAAADKSPLSDSAKS